MKKNRIQTFNEITHYLEAPLFNDMFDAYCDFKKDDMVIVADNPDHIRLLYSYADVLGSAIPQDVLKSCDVPGNCILYIQGRAIERFADSLLEILMHRLFKTQSDCA
jgi:hypothetical protein